MKEITQLYKEKNDASETNNSKQKSIKELVVCLLDLRSNNWYNSIDTLPEGTNKMDENLLLLWKQNEQFDKLFMTESDPISPSPRPRCSPRRTTPTRDERQTNTRLDLDSC